jgi:hypothetical protein
MSGISDGQARVAERPLLSICLVGRNEEYQGDYLYRMRTCLNFLGRGLANLGRQKDVEILITDWGSDVPLHKELALLPEARDLVRCIVVPPALARERQRDAKFPYTISANTAMRRAAGEFICDLTADVILTGPVVAKLMSILDGAYPNIPVREAMFPILRRQLPMCQAKRKPSLRELDEYLNRNLATLPPDGMGCGYGWAAGVMMHRSLWEATRAYDESMLYWGWSDIDFALRMTQRYPIIELANFGICGVHLQHYFQTPDDPVFQAHKKTLPNDTPAFVANGENWGLADEKLEMYAPERVALDVPADETSRVGSLESWDVTPRQIVEQLTTPALHQQVQGLLQSVHIELDVLRPSPSDSNAFVGLVWHARRRGVRTYVETGSQLPYGACLVARHSPGAELYIVIDRNLPQHNGSSCELLSSNLLKGLGLHGGYVRYVGDDAATAVERISKSSGGRFAVDLALVRASVQVPCAADQAVELAGFLTPGGAIVVAAADEPSFRTVWGTLSARRPSLTYLRFADGRSGIALAASLAG